MSDYAREFVYLAAELRRYETCGYRAVNDAVGYWLWFRVRQGAATIIGAGL